MAKMIGGASAYLKQERFLAKYDSFLWMLLLFLVTGVYFGINRSFLDSPFGATVLFLFALSILRFLNKQAWKKLYRAKHFKDGLAGEETVAHSLVNLPDDYVVIQDVKLPNTRVNVDFVVLGPNGIWAVEVKSHAGAITYDNGKLLKNGYPFEKNILWQAQMEAKELTEYLQSNIDRNLYANALLVFSNQAARMKFGTVPIKGVRIIHKSWLRDCIVRADISLVISAEQIEQVTALLHPQNS